MPSRDFRELELSLWVLQMNPQLMPRYEKMAKEAVDELNSRDIIKHVQVNKRLTNSQID